MTVPTALARPIIRLNLRNVWRWFAFGTLIGGVAGVGTMISRRDLISAYNRERIDRMTRQKINT